MMRVICSLAVFCLAGSAAALAQPLSLCSYLSPRSQFRSLTLSANYRYFNDQFLDNRDSVDSGSLRLSGTRFFDSPSLGQQHEGTLKVEVNRGMIAHKLNGASNIRGYFDGRDLFGFGGLEVDSATDMQGPGVNAVGGLGFGRFRDVTPLAKAVRMQEQLLAMKSLQAPLPNEILTAVAHEIGRRIEYRDASELVAKVQALIESSGKVVSGRLGAMALLRIEELLRESGDNKLCGWDARVGMGYELLDPQGGPRDLLLTASFNYALAPAPRSQFASNIRWTSSPSISHDYSLMASATYSYRLSENSQVSAAYGFLRSKAPGQAPSDMQNLDIHFAFRIGAQIGLTIDIDSTLATGFQEWTQGLAISLSYDFF